MKYIAIVTVVVVFVVLILAASERSARAEAERALLEAGFKPTEIRPLLVPTCMKNRFGYEFRQGDIRGKVCVGALLKPKITVY